MSSPEMKDVFSLFTFISERGILSGLYLAILGFGLIVSDTTMNLAPDLYIWVIGACILIGVIVSNLNYELLILIYRQMTDPIVLHHFYKTVQGNVKKEISSYDYLRQFRESVLAATESEHFKNRIEKDENLRQTLTYLSSSSVIAIIMLFIARENFSVHVSVMKLETIVVSYIFVSSFIGLLARSVALGKTLGLSYLYRKKTSKQQIQDSKE